MKALDVFIDQYEQHFYARTLKDLRNCIPGAVSKMYRDGADGQPIHVGYCIGKLWLTRYTPVEKTA